MDPGRPPGHLSPHLSTDFCTEEASTSWIHPREAQVRRADDGKFPADAASSCYPHSSGSWLNDRRRHPSQISAATIHGHWRIPVALAIIIRLVVRGCGLVRVVLLQTDNVLPQFTGEHGDYPDMFRSVLAAPDMDVEVVDVRETVPARGAGDGYVITGSRHSVYDDLPWIQRLAGFLRDEIACGRKVVGICFGHQLLAHCFGGEVKPAPVGWEVGVKDTTICETADWMSPPARRIHLISSHKDQVAQLPEGAVVTATSANCPVAGFQMGRNVITFQGHPEFRPDYSRALMEYRREVIGEERFKAGVESLGQGTDAELVGHWILEFLRS